MRKSTSLIDPDHILFDRRAVADHRRRAARIDWPRHRFLFDEVAARLAERLLDINHDFGLALDLGGRGGGFAEQVISLEKAQRVIRTDICEDMLREVKSAAVVLDEEFLPFKPETFDLVGTVLALHWTNDLPGALSQIRSILKPNGLFLGALFGIDSLQELKSCLFEAESEIKGGVSPRVSPFTEVRDAGSLLQRAGLALPVTDTEMITFKYEHPFALMRELRGMGEANALMARQKNFTGSKVLMRAAELYLDRYADEGGRVPATFQIIYMTGWSPHDSQQQPLRRGSARHSMSDFLEK